MGFRNFRVRVEGFGACMFPEEGYGAGCYENYISATVTDSDSKK